MHRGIGELIDLINTNNTLPLTILSIEWSVRDLRRDAARVNGIGSNKPPENKNLPSLPQTNDRACNAVWAINRMLTRWLQMEQELAIVGVTLGLILEYFLLNFLLVCVHPARALGASGTWLHMFRFNITAYIVVLSAVIATAMCMVLYLRAKTNQIENLVLTVDEALNIPTTGNRPLTNPADLLSGEFGQSLRMLPLLKQLPPSMIKSLLRSKSPKTVSATLQLVLQGARSGTPVSKHIVQEVQRLSEFGTTSQGDSVSQLASMTIESISGRSTVLRMPIDANAETQSQWLPPR